MKAEGLRGGEFLFHEQWGEIAGVSRHAPKVMYRTLCDVLRRVMLIEDVYFGYL
jgi:hypothetical protein